MSIFDRLKEKIIVSEPTILQNTTEAQAPTTTSVKPEIADIVKEHMRLMSVQNNSATAVVENTPEPVAVHEELVVPQKEELVVINAPEKIVIEKIATDLEPFKGRHLLGAFMAEVAEITEIAQTLDKAITEKNSGSGKIESQISAQKSLNEKLEGLEVELKTVFAPENTESQKTKITTYDVRTIFQKYEDLLETLGQATEATVSTKRKEDNTLSAIIQAKKLEISKLLKSVGGEKVFEKIKNCVNDAEDIASRNIVTNENYYRKLNNLFSTIHSKMDDKEHAKGLEMLVQSAAKGNIIDIFQYILASDTKK